MLSGARRLKQPLPCKGILKLWTVPAAIGRKIKRQFPRLKFE